LNVVDLQHVNVTIPIAELDGLIVLDRNDEFVGKSLTRKIHDVGWKRPPRFEPLAAAEI
jgi:hypothetical protein